MSCDFSFCLSLVAAMTGDEALNPPKYPGTCSLRQVWSVKSGTEIHSLKGHNGFVLCCVYSPNGNEICSASDDKTLKVILSVACESCPTAGFGMRITRNVVFGGTVAVRFVVGVGVRAHMNTVFKYCRVYCGVESSYGHFF